MYLMLACSKKDATSLMAANGAKPPLAGIRVVELGTIVIVPACAALLMGANVIQPIYFTSWPGSLTENPY
jgi:hypothetical protein